MWRLCRARASTIGGPPARASADNLGPWMKPGGDMSTDAPPRGDAKGDAGDESGESSVNEQEVADTLQRTVEAGQRRLNPNWAPPSAPGLVGRLDVATGVMALLVVEAETGNNMLSGLAFSSGF